MVLVVVFSKYGLDSVTLNISGVVLLSVIIAVLFETIRYKFVFNKIAEGVKVFFQAMGRSLAGVVILIVAAGVFAQGFKSLGMIDSVISVANTLGFGALGMGIVFVLITTAVTIVTGSNGASFYPLLEFIPQIASKLKVDPVTIVLPMHQASTIARPMSPVAGVVVAISGMLKLNPIEIVKRCSVPAILGLISHHIFVFLLVL